jgi:hypothetical protein
MKQEHKNGAPGIWWIKKSKSWGVQISVNHKKIHVGCFKSIDDAMTCREKAEDLKDVYEQNKHKSIIS